MNILMVAPGFSPHSHRPLLFLLKLGFRVVFLDAFNPRKYIPHHAFKPKKNHFVFVHFPFFFGKKYFQTFLQTFLPFKTSSKIIQSLDHSWSSKRLQKIYSRYSIDLVHIHWIDSRALYFIQSKSKPIVLSSWGSDIQQHFLPKANPHSTSQKSHILSHANAIIVDDSLIQKKCLQLISSQYNPHSKKIPILNIHLGVNSKLFSPNYSKAVQYWKKKLNIPHNPWIILSARAWHSVYNHHHVLKAFSLFLKTLQNQTPQNHIQPILIFKTSGKNTLKSQNYQTKIQKLATSLHLHHSIRWLPELPSQELPVVYNLCDVVVNCPSYDAFPVTFFEAFACLKPVISYRLQNYLLSPLAQYLHFVPTNNVQALAQAFLDSSQKKIPTQKITTLSKARNLVCQQFDESLYAQKLISLYHQILKKINQK